MPASLVLSWKLEFAQYRCLNRLNQFQPYPQRNNTFRSDSVLFCLKIWNISGDTLLYNRSTTFPMTHCSITGVHFWWHTAPYQEYNISDDIISNLKSEESWENPILLWPRSVQLIQCVPCAPRCVLSVPHIFLFYNFFAHKHMNICTIFILLCKLVYSIATLCAAYGNAATHVYEHL